MDPSAYNINIINPFAFSLLIVMCIMVLFGKRENIVITLIITSCFITGMQRIVIAEIDFPYVRILIIIGLLRLYIRGELSSIKLNTIDKTMIAWIIIRTITHVILLSTTEAFIFRLGETIDILGAYILIRTIINESSDYDLIIKTLIIASVPFAFFMVIEHLSGGRNFFSVLGGVLEFSMERDGKLRAQGAFSHPIMAGTFGATLLPFSWCIWQRNKKILALSGCITSFVITIASSSSGPLITLFLGIFGILFWNLRQFTKIVRNSFFLLLILLHLVMKAPVWDLISRIDVVGGSTGYHRSMLIDAAVNHFTDWFLIGIVDTRAWGSRLFDITNQYILEGVEGGLLPFILFILLIIKGFQYVGSATIKLENQKDMQKLAWGLGVVLFAHTVSFISVSYFGQMVFFYYLLLAMISSLNNLPEIKSSDIII